jgi:hypothetical protein
MSDMHPSLKSSWSNRLARVGVAAAYMVMSLQGLAAALTFDPSIDRELTATSPTGSTTADFNEDGYVDLAFAMSGQLGGDGGLSVVLSDGMGGYDDDTPFDEGWFAPRALIAKDFDGDGHDDLAAVGVSVGSVGTLQVFLGDGLGEFATPPQFEVAMSGFPIAIEAGLVDADSAIDLLVVDSSGITGVSLLLGVGNGTFAAPQVIPGSTGTSPRDIVVGDLDKNGILDFVTNDAIYHGQGAGNFSRVFNTGGEIAVAVGDLNNDGFLDVLVLGTGIGNNELQSIMNDGAGGYSFSASFSLPSVHLEVELTDMNGDGFLDAVVTHSTGDAIGIYQGMGDGSFGSLESAGMGSRPHPLVVHDLNRDGLPDLAAGYGGPEPFASLFLQNLPSAGGASVQMAAVSYAAFEGAGSTTVTVQRSGDSTTAVGVDYASANGSATAGEDYESAVGTLVFPAGVLAVTFDIVLIDDTLREDAPETVTLLLSSPTGGATLGLATSATLSIMDSGNDTGEAPADVPALSGSALLALGVLFLVTAGRTLHRGHHTA